MTGIFPLNPRVVSQLWIPTAKNRSKSRSNTNRILKTFLTPSTAFGNKFSSLSNSTPFLKPILLVQSYSSCSIRSKISDLQRRTCDSLASPEVWSDDLKSDSSRYNGARWQASCSINKNADSDRLSALPKAQTPSKTQNTIKTSSTIGPPETQPLSALSTLLLTLLGWGQRKTIMSLSSWFYDLLAMRDTGRYMGTGPRRAVGSSVIVQVLLCWSMVCPCAQGRSEVTKDTQGWPRQSHLSPPK